MANENRVQIIIDGNAAGAVNAFRQVGMAGSGLNNILREIGTQMLGFAGGMALLDGVKQGFNAVVKEGIGVNAAIEQARIQFKVLTGSAAEAAKTVKYLYDYAGKTPFEFPGVLKAASVIKGVKLDMQKWIPVIGDMAAAGQAAGLSMDQVALAISKVRSGQVGEFFETVGAYLGITRQDLEKYGVAWEASGELADRSAAGIQRVLEAIYEEATTRFKGMAQEQSNSFLGMWSTIKDSFGMIEGAVLRPLFNRLHDDVLPAMRELASTFQEAYDKAGLFGALREIVPPGLKEAVNDLGDAWSNLKDTAGELGDALGPVADAITDLAGAGFGLIARESASLAKSLTELTRTLLEIPGVTFAIQALAAAFLLFRGVPAVIRGVVTAMKWLGGSALFTPIIRFLQLIRVQWALAAMEGVGFGTKIAGVLSYVGKLLFGSIGWWALLIGAIVAGAVLVVRNWKQVGPFFSALWNFIKASALVAWRGILVGAQELRYGIIAAFNAAVAGAASAFARLVNTIKPVADKILPEGFAAKITAAGKAAESLARARSAATAAVGRELDTAKGSLATAAAGLSKAWRELKSAGSVAFGAIKEDITNMAKGVKDALTGSTKAAEDNAKANEKAAESAQKAGDKGAAAADKMNEALERLKDAANKAGDAIIGLFSEIPSAIGAGTSEINKLITSVKLAMADVEAYIAAGGVKSGQAIRNSLELAMKQLPWAVQEIGPRTVSFLQQMAKTAALLVQLPLEEARKKGIEMAGAVSQAWVELSNKARDYARNLQEHLANIGALTTQQQIDGLRSLISAYQWTVEERWRLEEELYRRNQDLLDEEIQAVKDAYEERLRVIEEETDAEVKALQERLKAFDETKKQRDREKAEADHQKKLQKLYEERKYHELRTGREHQEKIKEIDRQIAEENQRWQEEQHRWTIEDQKEQIQEEIELAKERGEKRKKALEEEFEATLRLYEKQFRDLTARVAIWEPEYIGKFKTIGQRIIEALASGAAENMPLLEQIRQQIESALPGMSDIVGEHTREEEPPDGGRFPTIRTIMPGQYDVINQRAIMPARELAALLGLGDPTWQNGVVEINGERFSPARVTSPGTAWLRVTEVAQAFGWDVKWDPDARYITLSKAHTGAKTMTGGIAELLPGELIFPPDLAVKLERLINVLSGWGNLSLAGTGITINGPLFHAERVEFQDRTDMEVFSRELSREVRRLGRG